MRIIHFSLASWLHDYLPPQLRHYSVRELAKALLAPLDQVWAAFFFQQDQVDKQLRYDTSMLGTTKALNDLFNPAYDGGFVFDEAHNAIYIEETELHFDPYLFRSNENDEDDCFEYLSSEMGEDDTFEYLSDEGEFLTDFIVRIPDLYPDPSPDENNIRAWLRKRAPLGTIFSIDFYPV